MEVDPSSPASASLPDSRWDFVRKVLERPGPFQHPNFTPSPDVLDTFLRKTCRVLVIGAGGLGCELLKCLALQGFGRIDVIDMDTIDLSNLNRQFLFRTKDVGRYKAEVAAEFIHKRVPGCTVTAHNCPIQDYDETFYRQFHMIVSGLDSIVARRWINALLVSMVEYDDDGQARPDTITPLVDGGTEGFKGNARIVIPTMTACIDCTLDLFPPQINFPLCTLAHTPRLPEHCIEYVRLLLWPKENPFDKDTAIDGDDPQHITWILERSQERAAEYGIAGVTYRLTQGVVKRIIPAVASTNAVIAAVCALEVFKLATSCADPLQNYMVFNDTDGVYTYAYEAEKNDNCMVCSKKRQNIVMKGTDKLQDLIDYLVHHASYQMKSPGLTTHTADGKSKTLYMAKVSSIEAATRPNLKKTLADLGLFTGCELVVADATTPQAILFKLTLQDEDGGQ